ncbi:hypothetical protein DY251_00950 [Mesorhizobium denitrificans]|uniref:Uncharacterized protein n=1 Tax=Mesorhizobium denitrificans TaxID=2294114 RepID=A0A371XJE6_9HYPH|nr:hypothetical protein DY251_00950 [Mesorhizobium denitrificans]
MGGMLPTAASSGTIQPVPLSRSTASMFGEGNIDASNCLSPLLAPPFPPKGTGRIIGAVPCLTELRSSTPRYAPSRVAMNAARSVKPISATVASFSAKLCARVPVARSIIATVGVPGAKASALRPSGETAICLAANPSGMAIGVAKSSK